MSSLLNWRVLGLAAFGLDALGLASGVSLLIGYLTPFGSLIACIVIVCSDLPCCCTAIRHLFDTNLESALAACIACALVCLGPGAFSVDARLFGRREIEIPN
jgi:uncharacterized membrane protein YphA (DoxX/SURF4 family)